jgi:hypothetical protein
MSDTGTGNVSFTAAAAPVRLEAGHVLRDP